MYAAGVSVARDESAAMRPGLTLLLYLHGEGVVHTLV